MPEYTLHRGDCRDVLFRLYPDNHFDSLVTDPPYGLSKEPDAAEVLSHWLAGDDYRSSGGGFMGKSWDSFVPGPATWREVLRVLKPGAYAVVFAGSRTQDLMSMALRLAGFEIRDTLMWVYGSGMPKSRDIGKALRKKGHPEAAYWEGFGTGLKPAYEPIILARKPFKGSVDANVLKFGTGCLNIDGCRVRPGERVSGGGNNFDAWRSGEGRSDRPERHAEATGGHNKGRWPTTLIHDGSAEVRGHFPDAKGQQGRLTGDEPSNKMGASDQHCYGQMDRRHACEPRQDADTSAARFFVQATAEEAPDNGRVGEASAQRRYDKSGSTNFAMKPGPRGGNPDGRWPANLVHDGSDEVIAQFPAADELNGSARFFYCAKTSKADRNEEGRVVNRHPTVKPTALMRWCCRLVTRPGGKILDPFFGSASTGKAALLEGFDVVGIEKDDDGENFDVCRERMRVVVSTLE